LWRKYKLENHTRLSTAVQSAEWDNEEMNYKVTVRDGDDGGKEEIVRAKIMIWAIGGFLNPMFPKELEETLGRFKGTMWHSARWRHDVELKGKKVGVIGNGCSA